MHISTRGRYALRAMVDVALHGGDRPVPRRKIAARQEISADYVAQLFRQLRIAGLVEGVKGPGGGYRLARDPATISVGDIVRAVEGPISLAECVKSNSDPTCRRIQECVTRLVWQKVTKTVEEALDRITVEDLRAQAAQLTVSEE